MTNTSAKQLRSGAGGSAFRTVAIDLGSGWAGRLLIDPAGRFPDRFDAWRDWLGQLVTDSSGLPECKVLKYSRTSEVLRAKFVTPSRGAHPAPEVVCKYARAGGLARQALARWRPSRARRNFDCALALLDSGIGTALPLAAIEQRRRPWGAWLVTEFLENLCDLDQIVLTELGKLDGVQAHAVKRTLIDACVELVVELERRGLHHRDLKASNILMEHWRGGERQPRAVLVDLDGIRRQRLWNPAWRRQPLVRLAASVTDYAAVNRTDFVRFLRGYFQRTGAGADSWRWEFRRLAAQATRYARASRSRKAHKLDGYNGGE